MDHKPIYNRVVLKLSGEALAGEKGHGFDSEILDMIAEEVIEISQLGVEVAIVVGGGNIWRGRSGIGMDRTTAYFMGMLDSVISALVVQVVIEIKEIQNRDNVAIDM